MIGKTVSYYKILEKLGEGGMGVVYKAEDTKLKRIVALKFLPPGLTRDPQAKERFLHEAQAAAALEHQHICNIYEIDETEDQIFIVMSCFEGQTLKEKIDAGPLKIDKALKIAVQAAEGLQAAHEKRIVHRDIKSANIMVTEKGQTKIMDFGLAKLKGQTKITKEGSTLGTAPYMSPEQAQGADVDHRTDIWSLGVVLYEMITGQLPFKGEYEQAVVYSIMNEEPEPLTALRTGVPLELERIINKTLAKNPSERYQHADDLVVDLKKLEKDTKPEITPSPRIIPIHPSKKPYRKFLIPGIFLLIAMAALAYFLFLKGPSKPASFKAALNPKRMVVAVFENLTGNESLDVLGRIAADWLTQGISRLEIVETVPNMVVMELLPAKKSGEKGPQSMVYLQSLAKDVDARTMITGSYYLSGENLCFQANLTDMEQEKLLFSLEPIIGPKKSPINVIDKLKQKVIGALITYFDPGYDAPPLGNKTPTFAAYKELMAGLELFGIDYSRAITHFERAMELDPDFYVPKLSIAIAYGNLGEYARLDTILRQLYEKRDHLSDFERYLLEWLRADMAGNLEKSLRMMRKAGDIAKKSPAVWYTIGRGLLLLNRPRETIDVYEQFGEKSWSFFWGNSWRIDVQAAAYHMLGDFQKELELAKKGQEIFPENLDLLSIETRALAAMGKTDEVKKVIDKSLIVSTSPGTPGDVMWEAALELRAHGHMKAYREIVTRAIDWYKNRPPGEAVTEKHRFDLAEFLYLAEQWDESEKIFKDLSRKKPDKINYKGYLGVLAARKGNLKEARKISDELKKMSRPYLFGQHTYWCARIASLLGEKQRAVELLRESFAQGKNYGTYLHQVIDFEPIKDYPPFKELMRPKG
jgi:serine/threonine protein kinase/tetratricopeptide (TPR) repeat protein